LDCSPRKNFLRARIDLIQERTRGHEYQESQTMEIDVDSFGAVISDPATGISVSPARRTDNLPEEIVLADQVVFGVGEHHRSEFVDSAPVVILGAAATRTKNIRLTSAVTVLSAADPIRVFQEFATLDDLPRSC
jgi:hypothetical protein